AASFPYLAGKECVGTQVGGIPGGGGENTFPNGCVNGKDTNGDGILDIGDDDGDGAIDCADPDCATDQACISSTQVKITGTPLPSGYLKSNYIVNIEATGGKPRYTWELLNNGGFTDFVINQYTGVITGTLNQCPGTYNTIQVKVTDSTTPTPTTDTRSFSITVNKNILINGSSAVTWSDPDWEEPYNITAGQYIGTSIGWDLTTGGATGFTVAKTGSDSAVIKKTGATTVPPYTYTFNLTATDTFPACAGPPPTNTTSKAIEVTLTAVGAAMPTRSTAVAWWRFDECLWNGTTGEVKDSNPNLLHGTATSGALTTTGVTCRGGYFDGVDDQVSVPDNNLLGFNGTTAAFSISFWIKVPTNVSGPSANIVAKGTNYVVTYDFRNGNDRITFTIGGTTLTGPTTVDLANNSWHHIAVTAGNTGTNEMKIYTDGVLMIQGNNITPASITDPLLIGGAWGPSAFFNIDEVTIYNRELSLAEVTALWNNGTPPTRTCTTCP
ncbi:MAG: LamG domain-containing protein, partial [Nitrospinota bacterium]